MRQANSAGRVAKVRVAESDVTRVTSQASRRRASWRRVTGRWPHDRRQKRRTGNAAAASAARPARVRARCEPPSRRSAAPARAGPARSFRIQTATGAHAQSRRQRARRRRHHHPAMEPRYAEAAEPRCADHRPLRRGEPPRDHRLSHPAGRGAETTGTARQQLGGGGGGARRSAGPEDRRPRGPEDHRARGQDDEIRGADRARDHRVGRPGRA